MELILIGSGTGVPSLKRGGPSILLKSGANNVLVDCGLGILHKLLKIGLTCNDIDTLLFTHIHPDHTAELVSLLFASKSPEMLRTKPLKIVGGEGFIDFYNKLRGVYGSWIEPQSFSIDISEKVGETFTIDDLRISTVKTNHSQESVAFAINTANKKIVISGDTGYCQGIVNIAKDADLLLLECSLPDNKGVAGHLTPSEVVRIAEETNCKKLVIYHLYPSCDASNPLVEIKKRWPGEVIGGSDMLNIHL
ncbi:MAG: MBL fold metallo-hydrolase [Nitrospinota bacterium]|nr:MBL fold metallo-hydrolase [Nitrospinota bacterium]